MAKITIDDAIGLAVQGGSLFLPGSTGAPGAFLEAVASRPGCLAGVSVTTGFVSGVNNFASIAGSGAVLTGFFPATGAVLTDLRLIPSTYFGIDRRIAALRPAAVVIEVAPPRADGSSALGVAADFTGTACRSASIRIAIVNPAIPELPGAPRVLLADFTHACEQETPVLNVPQPVADTVSLEIAARVAAYVPDGSTIQIGIGRIPGQVMAALSSHRRLRFHSGIVTSGVRALMEAGALAGDSPVCAASLGGDSEFYSWLAGRPEFRLAPVRYTHAPGTLAVIDGLVSINSALEVDLLGQVNAEWLGGRRVSAPGGLPDFAHAARRSPGGLAIVALPSTDASGRHSRITARLAVPPTLAAGGVDVVVTEYGAADLRGRTTPERAVQLAAIAHPAFRDGLTSASRA
jgi:acyl-CoA hydrolase